MHALAAWAAVQAGAANPLIDALCADPRLARYWPDAADEMRGLLDASGYVGDAPQRARALAGMIRKEGEPR